MRRIGEEERGGKRGDREKMERERWKEK